MRATSPCSHVRAPAEAGYAYHRPRILFVIRRQTQRVHALFTEICVDENTCTGASRTNVTYWPDVNDDTRYFIVVRDNGVQQAESKLSCYDVLKFVVGT